MITLAYNIEWIDRDPFRKYKQKLIPTRRGFLTSEELGHIEELNIESMRLKTVKSPKKGWFCGIKKITE